MKSREIFSIVVLALGLTAAMLPYKSNDSIQLNEQQLLQEMLNESNYVTVDELAHLIISGDPSIRLIDVRPVSEFEKPLPRAINVPIDSIFSDDYAYLFDQTTMKNVIYGADDRRSTQVWMITKQLGYANNYLLKGGLEAWDANILNPSPPLTTAPKEAFDLYEKRQAYRQFFTGEKAIQKILVKPMAPVQGRKKKRVAGGCS